MTPDMNTKDFAEFGAPDLVYVRAIRGSDVLDDVGVDTASDIEIDPDQILYAVHGADGERLAIMLDRETAFAAAVAHDLEPMSVH